MDRKFLLTPLEVVVLLLTGPTTAPMVSEFTEISSEFPLPALAGTGFARMTGRGFFKFFAGS